MLMVMLAVHHSTEAAPEREVFELGAEADLEEDRGATDVTSLLQIDAALQTQQASGGGQQLATSNSTNSSNNTQWEPAELKKPYHKHMKANKDMWARLGGWTANHEKRVAWAQKQHKLAEIYEKNKKREKDVASMGCPCPGEKYYDLVQDNPGKFAEAAHVVATASNHTVNGTHGPSAGNPDMKPVSSLEAKMIKKYGKPGPSSVWQPKHEKDLKRAHKALKRATAAEDAAFKQAIPEFKKMQDEEPAFFTNGDCQCPEGWTFDDAKALAEKETKDVEDAYWSGMRKHRAMIAKWTGEADRIAKMEADNDPLNKQEKDVTAPSPPAEQLGEAKNKRGVSEERAAVIYRKFVVDGLQQRGYAATKAQELFDQYTRPHGVLGDSNDEAPKKDAPKTQAEKIKAEVQKEESKKDEKQLEEMESKVEKEGSQKEEKSKEKEIGTAVKKEAKGKAAAEAEPKAEDTGKSKASKMAKLTAKEKAEDDADEPKKGDDVATLKAKADRKIKVIRKLEKEKAKLVAIVNLELQPDEDDKKPKDKKDIDGKGTAGQGKDEKKDPAAKPKRR